MFHRRCFRDLWFSATGYLKFSLAPAELRGSASTRRRGKYSRRSAGKQGVGRGTLVGGSARVLLLPPTFALMLCLGFSQDKQCMTLRDLVWQSGGSKRRFPANQQWIYIISATPDRPDPSGPESKSPFWNMRSFDGFGLDSRISSFQMAMVFAEKKQRACPTEGHSKWPPLFSDFLLKF